MFAKLKRSALSPMRGSVILLGFSVPISVALDNLLLAGLLLSAMFYATEVWQIAKQHPVARSAWLLFGGLLLGVVYGVTPINEAASIVSKYIDLAFIPLFIMILHSVDSRRWAQYGFLAAMALTLLLSWLVSLTIIPVQFWMDQATISDNPVIFHSHITQSNMMAFAVFLALLNMRESVVTSVRLTWGVFALLGSINVFFMVQGRTGYLILLMLLCWFAWTTLVRYMRKHGRQLSWPQGAALLLVCAGVAFTAYHSSARLYERTNQVVSEYHAWQPNQGRDTSTGQRLDFYFNTLQIIQQYPVFGVGTGGFAAAFAQHTADTAVMQTTNPHNEYLLITVQTGLLGLALLLYLFATLWRVAPQLNTAFEQDAARGLVLAYLVNSTFNSALHDHSDGLFFAFMTAVLFAGLRLERKNG